MFNIALTHTKSKVRVHHLRRILPWRRNKKGVRPTIIGPAAQGPEAGEEEQWRFPNVALTAIEKKMLVAEVMRIAVEAVFQTHVYQFGDMYYHQQDGGPIGLRATGAIARVVMADWDEKLVNLLVANGMTWSIAARYVDDVRLILAAIKKGWRWQGRRLLQGRMAG